MIKRLKPRATALSAVVLLILPGFSGPQAAFNLNWKDDESNYLNDDTHQVCNMSNIDDGFRDSCATDESGSHDDGSAFFQNQFDQDGDRWFHIIVGDRHPDTADKDPFAQEVFIRTNSDHEYNSDFQATDSVGDSNDEQFNIDHPYSADSSKTGTGSANPTSVIMRQVMDTATMTQEFLKDQLDRKPKISQTIDTSQFTSVFEVDMRGKDFSDATAIDPDVNMTNTMTLQGADAPAGGVGDFDLAEDAPDNTTTAGAFTYTEGSGFGGSGGTYDYATDQENSNALFHPFDLDWSGFCDPDQNSDWSGNGACTNGDGSGGGDSW